MTKTSLFAGLKLFAAQGALQLLLHAQGLTLEQTSIVACGAMMLAPLYSRAARALYAQAFSS
jgi:hypothetical protein